ncbi:MAG TPA: DMT family transporter [Gaiellaceae bacterium]|nr:DMT family transporter [Gaiellaceae bacterium]
MLTVLFGVLAGIGFGLLAVTVRSALARGGDPEVGAIVMGTVALAVDVVLAAAFGDLGKVHPGDLWPFVLIGALVPGASQILFIQSVRLAGPSRAAIMIGVAPLVSALLAIVFLGEPVQVGLVIGTVIIVAGGAFLVAERSRPKEFQAIGMAVALTCAVMFGVRDNLVRDAQTHHHPPPLLATAAALLGACLTLLVYLLVVRRRELRERLQPSLRPFVPAGLTLGTAYAFLVEALAHGRVTVVAPLNATQSIFAVVFAAIIVGRAELIGRRTVIAGLLIVAGGALIGATR